MTNFDPILANSAKLAPYLEFLDLATLLQVSVSLGRVELEAGGHPHHPPATADAPLRLGPHRPLIKAPAQYFIVKPVNSNLGLEQR